MTVKFTRNVGVAPGTTVIGLGASSTRANIRWDLIGAVSGVSLVIGLAASMLAARFGAK